MSNKKLSVFFLVLFLSSYSYASKLIFGNALDPDKTFAFSIGQTLMSQGNNFYISASLNQDQVSLINNFSLAKFSFAHNATDQFTPLAPEHITIEGVPDRQNPLFNQKIVTFGLFESSDGWFDFREFPVVVTESSPFDIYLLDMQPGTDKIQLMVAPNINDAEGNRTSGIIGVTTDIASHVFAAVKPMNGLFGDDNSGIAMVLKGFVTVTQDEVQSNIGVFHQVDAATGNIVTIPQAVKLDKSSPVIKIGRDLSAMQNFVSLTWSPSLQRLFIGLQVTAQDGARGVAVGKLVNGGLELQTIAPDNAFAPGNQQSIVGVNGAGLSVSINHIKTMCTSTALQYLLVSGGNQSADTATQTVYALPLVNSGDQSGSIASKNAQPQDIYSSAAPFHLIGRIITQLAEVPEDMPQATDAAVMVGGRQFVAGTITDMIVRDDTVFVFVGKENISGATGVYYSQALFDSIGKIKGWTDWQRASGIADTTFFGALNSATGSFIVACGNDEQSINTVKKTIWSAGDPQGLQPITDIVQTALTPQTGGVQSLYTFLPATPGLSHISLLAFGGSGTVVLAQTGALDTVLIPTQSSDYFPTQVFEHGTITHDSIGSKSIVITGGALDDIGPITAIEIGQAGANGWLFVGGIDGVAVLSKPDGSGWNTTLGQLGNGFNGLVTGMQFTNIGNYSFVKKLIADENFLYIITDTIVDRINLNTSNFGNNILDIVTVATQQGLREITQTGGIVDALVSGTFAVLATTGGLVRVGDGKAINNATHESELDWTPILIPEAAGAPVQLRTVTKTGRAQDIARMNGGHVYVLNSSNGFEQSQINRFAIQPITNNDITSNTITHFNDLYVQNIASFFLNFGQFKNIFTTDGALYFSSRGAINGQIATVALTPSVPEPRVGISQVGEKSIVQDIIFTNETELNAFERSQGSGSWIVAGNKGMDVFE